MRVVVVGIPGVGKTTVVGELISAIGGAKLITFGSVMLEEARRRKLISHRDELRKLPVEKQKRLQAIAASTIAAMKERAVVIDTHLFVRTDEGFWPGLPFDVVRSLKPTHLVLVEAKPEEISARRKADKMRYRDSVADELLAEELALARGFLAVSSTLTGAPMMIVNNNDGRAKEVARDIAKVLVKVAA